MQSFVIILKDNCEEIGYMKLSSDQKLEKKMLNLLSGEMKISFHIVAIF